MSDSWRLHQCYGCDDCGATWDIEDKPTCACDGVMTDA
jgi:hypothetical protein